MAETERERSARLALRSVDAEAALEAAQTENDKLRADRQWLIKAGDYIAASAEWFADVKSVPKSEMQRHRRICEDIHDAIAGKAPPPARYPRDYHPDAVMQRLAEVAKRLRERTGDKP